jgi:septal ring factor EnvC (AmiA/AmiB activator)
MTAHIEPITVTVDSLIQELYRTYAEAVSGLNVERGTLESESEAIQAKSDELKLLMPAQAREAQRQADVLLLAGKHEEAQTKREAQAKAERAPADLEQRRATIAERIEAIASEKGAIKLRVFAEWFPRFRVPLVKQQQTLCEVLDAALAAIKGFESEPDAKLPRSLITANTPSDLVAREHGPEKPIFLKLREWFGFGGRK